MFYMPVKKEETKKPFMIEVMPHEFNTYPENPSKGKVISARQTKLEFLVSDNILVPNTTTFYFTGPVILCDEKGSIIDPTVHNIDETSTLHYITNNLNKEMPIVGNIFELRKQNLLYFANDDALSIKKIEVDFGNGQKRTCIRRFTKNTSYSNRYAVKTGDMEFNVYIYILKYTATYTYSSTLLNNRFIVTANPDSSIYCVYTPDNITKLLSFGDANILSFERLGSSYKTKLTYEREMSGVTYSGKIRTYYRPSGILEYISPEIFSDEQLKKVRSVSGFMNNQRNVDWNMIPSDIFKKMPDLTNMSDCLNYTNIPFIPDNFLNGHKNIKMVSMSGINPEYIGENAFANCPQLARASICSWYFAKYVSSVVKLREIRSGVFENCINLSTVSIADTYSVTGLDSHLFNGEVCEDFHWVERIGDRIFKNCHNLNFGESGHSRSQITWSLNPWLKSIGDEVFMNAGSNYRDYYHDKHTCCGISCDLRMCISLESIGKRFFYRVPGLDIAIQFGIFMGGLPSLKTIGDELFDPDPYYIYKFSKLDSYRPYGITPELSSLFSVYYMYSYDDIRQKRESLEFRLNSNYNGINKKQIIYHENRDLNTKTTTIKSDFGFVSRELIEQFIDINPSAMNMTIQVPDVFGRLSTKNVSWLVDLGEYPGILPNLNKRVVIISRGLQDTLIPSDFIVDKNDNIIGHSYTMSEGAGEELKDYCLIMDAYVIDWLKFGKGFLDYKLYPDYPAASVKQSNLSMQGYGYYAGRGEIINRIKNINPHMSGMSTIDYNTWDNDAEIRAQKVNPYPMPQILGHYSMRGINMSLQSNTTKYLPTYKNHNEYLRNLYGVTGG